MKKRIRKPGVREGYDRWAEEYDQTPNPLVALDRRHTISVLCPRAEELILDAGCGTGANLHAISQVGSCPVGLDFSLGMLRVAQRSSPSALLVQADLNRDLPVQRAAFDAVVCALVSEHLTALRTFLSGTFAALKYGGRMVFSAFHPEMAASGVEAKLHTG